MQMSSTSRAHIAGEVRAAMARRGMTQAQVAKLVGISRPTMNGRLRGESAFNTDELFVISDALDIAFASLWPDEPEVAAS